MKLLPLDFEINVDLIAEGFTQSEMQELDNCPEKWYLRYNLLLAKKGQHSWALTYGTWMHDFLEQWYATKGKRAVCSSPMKNKGLLTQAQLADHEYWSGLLKVQTEIYASHYKQDFKFFDIDRVETIAEVEFEGIRLKGKLDLGVNQKNEDAFYLEDHKTASRFDKDTLAGWDFRFQFMFYIWLATKQKGWIPKGRRLKGFIVNGIRKPQLKRGANESVQDFLQRVQTDMLARPEHYFYREKLPLAKGGIEHFEATILRPKIDRIKFLLSTNTPPSVKRAFLRNKNTDNCLKYNTTCEFLNCCKHGLQIEQDGYRRRPMKHEELEIE